MTSVQGSLIRQLAKKRQIVFSEHALERMFERGIEITNILESIQSGEEIEVQDFGPHEDIRVLFQEATNDIPGFYVVVAACFPRALVLTVCLTEQEIWQYKNGKLVRR